MAIGEKIKAARLRRRMSLADLARESGLTKGFLSQVESGRSNPSLASLRRIAHSLGAPLGSLVQEGAAHESEHETALPHLVRAAEVRAGHLPVAHLGRVEAGDALLVTIGQGVELSALPSTGDRTARAAVAVVAGGEAAAALGDRQELLREGDAIVFDPGAGFSFTSVGAAEALLFLYLPEGCDEPALALREGAGHPLEQKLPPVGPFRIIAMRAERAAAKRR